MATKVTQYETTTRGSEVGNDSNNNLYQSEFQKTLSNDNYANGMGLARPANLKSFEDVPGSEASDQYMLKNREFARFNDLKKAFGNPTINNAGIVLDSFGGAFGEAQSSPSKPDVQGGASK